MGWVADKVRGVENFDRGVENAYDQGEQQGYNDN
jgi:hypothetical protein